jgi:hypothetical protein
MKDFVYVYILVSQANPANHYTGIIRNLEQRLLEHNRGKCANTLQHRPNRNRCCVQIWEQSTRVREIFEERVSVASSLDAIFDCRSTRWLRSRRGKDLGS